MATGTSLRSFEVSNCPRCGKQHRFALAVKPAEKGVALFGGSQPKEVAFICPVTRKAFVQLITAEPDTEIIGPADPSQLVAVPASPPASAAPAELASVGPARGAQTNGEFEQWQRDSRSLAIDFSKTMLTVATGAIPVYFAVLKYLGIERASRSFWQRAAIIPPILFLASAVVFVLALRPHFSVVTESEFSEFRRIRLEDMNRFLVAATVLFMLAIAIAIWLFFAILI